MFLKTGANNWNAQVYGMGFIEPALVFDSKMSMMRKTAIQCDVGDGIIDSNMVKPPSGMVSDYSARIARCKSP